MIAFNRDFDARANQVVPTVSSEDDGTVSILGMESCDEFGQVVHILSPHQLMQLKSHPAATIFPCRDVDFARMRESLDTVEQQQPITLYGSGEENIPDGNCRVQAAIQLNKPQSAVWIDEEALNGLSPEKWVFDRNRANQGGRRLNDRQLALVAVRAEIETARREAKTESTTVLPPAKKKGKPTHTSPHHTSLLPISVAKQSRSLNQATRSSTISSTRDGSVSLRQQRLPVNIRTRASARQQSKRRLPVVPLQHPS